MWLACKLLIKDCPSLFRLPGVASGKGAAACCLKSFQACKHEWLAHLVGGRGALSMQQRCLQLLVIWLWMSFLMPAPVVLVCSTPMWLIHHDLWLHDPGFYAS